MSLCICDFYSKYFTMSSVGDSIGCQRQGKCDIIFSDYSVADVYASCLWHSTHFTRRDVDKGSHCLLQKYLKFEIVCKSIKPEIQSESQLLVTCFFRTSTRKIPFS